MSSLTNCRVQPILCKDSASEWNNKTKHAVFVFIPERSLSYLKIVQTSGITKQNTQFLFFIPERSLSYLKIVQTSGITKQNTQFLFLFLSTTYLIQSY